MYAKTFRKMGFESIHDLESFLNRDDVKQMIGEDKYDHYRELWLSQYAYCVMDEPKKKVKGKINWLAIVSPVIWYAYRRMYLVLFSLIGVLLALSFAETYYDFDSGAGFFGAMLALALMSKDHYLDHLVRCAKKIDTMPNQERVKDFLKWRKGTSIGLALGVIPLLIVVGVMTIYLAEILKSMN